MTTESLASRVDAGARLLDEKRPGWFREIAMDRLAMDSCTDCILGQIYGQFEHGETILKLEEAETFGFDILWICDRAFREDEKKMSEEYSSLADIWRAEIRKRLEAVA